MLEVLLGIVVLLELIAPFTPKSYGLDGGWHLNWIHEFSDLFASGVFLPRWVPGAFGGFGAAPFYVYPPLTFYLASVIRVLTGISSASLLFQIVGIVGTVASYFSCQLLLQSISQDRYWIRVGSLVYAFSSLRIFDLYNRCSLSSHVAYVFFPLVWLGLIKVQNKQNLSTIALLSASAAALALTSVPLSVGLAISVLPAMILCRKWLTVRGILSTVLSGILALLLTSFHFTASLTAVPFTRLKDVESFSSFASLNAIMHNYRSPEMYNLGLIALECSLIIAGLWRTLRKASHPERQALQFRKELVSALLIPALFLLFILLSSPFAGTIGSRIPPLELMQFGSRLWPQLLLGVSVVICLSTTSFLRQTSRMLVWVLAIGALGPALFSVFNLHLGPHSTPLVMETPVFRPIFTLKSTNQFLSDLPSHTADPTFLAQLSSNESIQSLDSSGTSFRVKFVSAHLVTFHQFYWPFRHLLSGEGEFVTHPDSIGRATALLPTGSYQCSWRTIPTPLEQAGLWASTSTLGFVLAALLFLRVRNYRSKRRSKINPV